MDRLQPTYHSYSIDSRTAASSDSLLLIDAPHFCCGVIVRGERVIRTAPIVRYLLGWDVRRLTRYGQAHGWRVEVITFNGGHDETNRSHFDDAYGDGAHGDGG